MVRHTLQLLLLNAFVVLCPALAMARSTQGTPQAEALMDRVAEAMGGAQAILDVRTMEATGYGMEAYFWGGGNVTGDPDAAQKWAENPDMTAVWDFENDRYVTRYRHNFLFPFGGIFGHSFSLSSWGIEADLATPANQFSFWAEAYQDNLDHYGLEVSMVSPTMCRIR